VSDKPEAAEGAKPAKSKKMLVIIIGAVVVLALVGGGAFVFLGKRAAADDAGDDAPPAKSAAAAPAGEHAVPPAYLPMDNMVVNLADPGGERVAQVGITLVVADAHAAETVKGFLPSIRSGVLMLISQRTSEELLTAQGKEKLKRDVLREASIPFGGGDDDSDDAPAPDTKKKKKKKQHTEYPVSDVLFSSFIVQ